MSEVPGPVDLAVIAPRPEACLDAVEECAEIGVHSVVIPTEGFADSEHGRSLQRELVARIRRHGMRSLGPGSLGMRAPATRRSTSPSPRTCRARGGPRSPGSPARSPRCSWPAPMPAGSACTSSWAWATAPTSPSTTPSSTGRTTRRWA
ncbi:CoA-binding protein [Brachybacterium sp. GPGPB12]|uniref:CoA-binding protein n=1 Tax=Brachybacterium sp. GPGPB12 TaxID=3023517 RepID=UPI0031342D70